MASSHAENENIQEVQSGDEVEEFDTEISTGDVRVGHDRACVTRGRARGVIGRGTKRKGVEITSDASKSTATHTPSIVWDHFTKQKIDGEVFAIYKHCNKQLKGHYSHGTNHLRKHMDICVRKNQLGIEKFILQGNASSDLSLYNRDTFDRNLQKEWMARKIIMHEFPLRYCELWAVRHYDKIMNPLAGTWSRNTIKKECMRLFEVEKEKTVKMLENTDSRVAITSDMWTSCQTKGYLVVTMHYIDSSWALHNRTIRFINVQSPHTAETLATELVETIERWNLTEKLSTITLDNCSINDAVIPLLVNSIKPENLILGGKFFHVRCCAHILNLIVKDGLMIIDNGIEKIRESVRYWSTGTKRIQKFEEVALASKIKNGKKLAVDCKTRWNSTYQMLSVALTYRDVFDRLKIREKSYKCAPEDSEWELAKVVCDHLQPFYAFTEIFSERVPDFDILSWWKMKRIRYPILSKIARDVLAIPMTTVASESAFSTSGRVVSKYRNKMRPDTIEALMCAQSWLWEPLREFQKIKHLLLLRRKHVMMIKNPKFQFLLLRMF